MASLGRTCLGFLIGAALASAAPAQDLKLDWVGRGARFDSYAPQHIPLSDVRPPGVRLVPKGLEPAVYGKVLVGPRETRVEYTLLIEERSDGDQRLWVDANGNGDLTDDPPVAWEKMTGSNSSHRGSATLQVRYPDRVLSLTLSLYRLRAPWRDDTRPSLFGYRQWGYQGRASLGGKSYRAMLDDELSAGDFRGRDPEAGAGSGVSLLLDVNEDGRFDHRGERFDVRKPFNVGGVTYELEGLTASGAGVVLARSRRDVPETKPLPVIRAGAPPSPFEAKTTTNETVRFPGDFRGRVVLLDFWATWCGPCRKEIPSLKSLYADYHSRGFDVVGVSLDRADGLVRLQDYARENGLTWPQVWDGKVWDSPVVKAYNVGAIPDAFLIDRSGLVLASGPGARGTLLRSAVEKALGGAPRSAHDEVAEGATPAVAEPSTSPPASAAGQPVRVVSEGPASENTIVWGSRRATVRVAPAPPPSDPLLAKAETAMRAGRLLSAARFLDRRRQPIPRALALASPSAKELTGRALARLAREAYLRAGWYYLCPTCGKRHLKLAGAYAVTGDTVLTAWHVMTPPSSAGEAFAVVVDGSDDILPITEVTAASETLDVVALRVSGGRLRPLALDPGAEVGDAAYCFSDPLRQKGYFSAGIVNRIYVPAEDAGREGAEPAGGGPRVDVSTDWGPGSSGAAVLDAAGNVIGQVSRIRPLFEANAKAATPDPGHGEDKATGVPLMTLHVAVPARSVLSLLRPEDRPSPPR